MREADLYPATKRYFEDLGYAAYAEVPAPHGGYVDLLAVREPVSIAVELKPRFSREAVQQAGRNKRYVWESYVAVPEGVQILPRRRAALKRHGAGLLLVSDTGVRIAFEARRVAPACTIRQAFGRYLQGELASLYATAEGGVPTSERVSAFRVLLEKVEASLHAQGGIANTGQILAATLAWNYFHGRRAGLLWILRQRFRNLADDLWTFREKNKSVRPPDEYLLPVECLVRTHLPHTHVCLPDPGILPRPGDFITLSQKGQLHRRTRVISAERHTIVETPARELRAGPVYFFRWRCPAELPPETLVVKLISTAREP